MEMESPSRDTIVEAPFSDFLFTTKILSGDFGLNKNFNYNGILAINILSQSIP